MSTCIRGRVTDAEGSPAAGVLVLLSAWPSLLTEPESGPVAVGPCTSRTDSSGEYLFQAEARAALSGRLRENAVSLRAFRGEQVSQQIVVDWERHEAITPPDLVLTTGVTGRVRVQWDDGSPAASVSLTVMLEEQPTNDERAGILAAQGASDRNGEFSFGPVPDRVYERIIVRASHPAVPAQVRDWEAPRLHDELLVELSLSRARVVRGQLIAADGRPAVGYRIAPWKAEAGDPDARQVVTTDASGDFTIAGVDQPGAIAVYDRLFPPPSGSDSREAALNPPTGRHHRRPVNPLLIHEVPIGRSDLGEVTLPRLGSLVVRLTNARGECPDAGHARWSLRRTPHGTRSVPADPDGVLRFERVPLGIPIDMRVRIIDSVHGELEQEFRVDEVKEGTIALQVTGAGTVVVRLHPAGSATEPLVVRGAVAECDECHEIGFANGPTSELRGWTVPGVYPIVKVRARGFQERVLKDVEVSSAGPTYLDVELEPTSNEPRG